MRVLDTIRLSNGSRIELCIGDLTALPRNTWFDAIIVSAFTNDFRPAPGTLIGALHQKGVSVERLSASKDVDYLEHQGTWLSRSFPSTVPGIGFDRIICFEPRRVGPPPRVVRSLFTALVPILMERPAIRSIAMPVLATGNQGRSLDEMLPAILRAATEAMERGLPLERLAVFIHSEEHLRRATEIFEQEQKRVGQFDVFISYAHRDRDAQDLFLSELSTRHPHVRVFLDRVDIRSGVAWQHTIFESLDRCRRIVALLSPSYLDSRMCIEEFNIGLMRNRDTGQDILRPLRMRTARPMTYIDMVQYIDCTEVDRAKVRAAVDTLVAGLAHGATAAGAPTSRSLAGRPRSIGRL